MLLLRPPFPQQDSSSHHPSRKRWQRWQGDNTSWLLKYRNSFRELICDLRIDQRRESSKRSSQFGSDSSSKRRTLRLLILQRLRYSLADADESENTIKCWLLARKVGKETVEVGLEVQDTLRDGESVGLVQNCGRLSCLGGCLD